LLVKKEFLMDQLTIALPKGRLLSPSVSLFKCIGVTITDYEKKSRRLVLDADDGRYRFLIAKPFDVPTYVEHGIADIGIVGSDVLMEENHDVHEPLELPFGNCKLVLAAPHHKANDDLQLHSVHRVATKYPGVTKRYFASRGIQVETIRLYGSVELAPITGLSDMIVDLVQTGRTLDENGLVPIAEVAQASARLIVNRVSYKIRLKEISALIGELSEATVC
jgi:ATP phosphoribosyltransferase